MSNDIDKKNIEVNNSISNLIYYWKAYFKDGSSISQFENELENRFKLVKEQFNDLIFFELYNKNNQEDRFIVDLERGFIFKNKITNYPESKETKNNIRLIFFRRHTVNIGTVDLQEKSHNIIYFLGLQYNTEEGNNRKIILQINEDGSFVIEN
jgi:hypothetical protein